MNQDIVLVSNSSMDLFPDNKLSDFRVRLPQTVTLDPSYRVALTRISFTKSFYNYEDGGSGIVMMSETNDVLEPDAETKAQSTLRCNLLPGYYTPESFVDMINIQVKQVSLKGNLGIIKYPKYGLTNGYLNVAHGTIDAGEMKVYRWHLKFDPNTLKILGWDKTNQHRPVFLNQGYTDVYVYSDLVYPSIVGDQSCELLTILDGQTDKPFGSHCCEVYDDPWYHKLAKTSFREIRIYLRTDTGRAPKFRFGRVSLRLSFKKEDGF